MKKNIKRSKGNSILLLRSFILSKLFCYSWNENLSEVKKKKQRNEIGSRITGPAGSQTHFLVSLTRNIIRIPAPDSA